MSSILGMAAALVMFTGMSLTTGTSGASVISKAKTPKPDLAFYKGKTITVIIPQAPGGSYSPTMVAGSQEVGQYLHATVNDVYISTAGGIVGMDQIAAEPPDGLTIGNFSFTTLISNVFSTGTTTGTFSMQKLNFFAGVSASPIAIVTCDNSSYSGDSMSQVVKATTPIPVVNMGTGTSYVYMKLFFNLYQTPIKSVTGFANTAATTAACLSGDGSLAIQAVASLTPTDFTSGLVHALVVGSAISKKSIFYPYFKNVPTLQQFFQKNPSKLPAASVVEKAFLNLSGTTSVGITPAGPPGMAIGKVLAMRAAWKYALTRQSVLSGEIADSVGYHWINPATLLPYIKSQLKHQPVMNRFINTNVS